MAEQKTKLWLDLSSVNAAIVSRFKSACDKYLRNFGAKMKNRMNHAEPLDNHSFKIHDTEVEGPSVYHRVSPVSQGKALKNEAELEGMRRSHLR